VRASVEAALVLLRDLGANVQDVDFPSVAQSSDIFAIAGRPEGASFFGQFTRTRPQDYGDDRARALLESLELILATDYLHGQRLRSAMRQELEGVLTGVDALITPTAPTVAHPIGQPFTQAGGQPVDIFSLWVGLTVPFDITGSPAISVPCGLSSDGLPIGLQIVGRAWDEPTVLRTAAAYEQATPWHQRHPTL